MSPSRPPNGSGDPARPSPADPEPRRVDALIRAALPLSTDHRAGDHERAAAILEQAPEIARANIWVAAMLGEHEAVAAMLERQPELANAKGGPENWEPLLYLCFSRFLRTDRERAGRMIATARLLLDHGADPNAYWLDPQEAFGNRETPLYGAAGVASNVELARMLVEAGADPNDGETAYHMVEHDGVPCAEFIVPKLQGVHRGAALTHKLDYDDLEGLRRLLELGIEPDGPSPFSKGPLHQAVFRGRARPFFELLIAHGADVDRRDGEGRTAYALAARTGRVDIMSWLREAGAESDLDSTDAFLAACAAGDTATVQARLAAEPELVAGLADADLAEICEAADAGNTRGVRTMLDAGWDVNTRGRVWKETPIHRAAMQGHVETVRLLLERGADLTVRDVSYQASPIGWAAHGEQPRLVELLTADPQRLDLRDAAQLGATDRVLELLADTDVNAPVAGGDAGVLLRAAAASGNAELVAELLARGANPRLANRDGDDAADIARRTGRDDLVALLTSLS